MAWLSCIREGSVRLAQACAPDEVTFLVMGMMHLLIVLMAVIGVLLTRSTARLRRRNDWLEAQFAQEIAQEEIAQDMEMENRQLFVAPCGLLH